MKPLRMILLTLVALPAAAQDCADGQRPFDHAAGTSCIPEDPQRIVATRGDSLVTPLLDIGAPVIGAGIRVMEDGTAYVRGASDIFGAAFVDAAGLASVGDPNQVDIEAVATLDPDLIFIRAREIDRLDQFEAIAPTVAVPADLPFLDHLAFIADAAGRAGTYDDRLAVYRSRVESLRTALGDPSTITISQLDIWEDGLWFYPDWGAVSQVIDDVGFTRPAILEDLPPDGFNGMSVERLQEFDGDIVISSLAPHFDQDVSMLTGLYDSVAPFWRQLPAIAAGDHYWYPRDIWVGYSFASLDRALDGLALLTVGREFDR
ncbi:ABC transporter substrate-binding protein [Aestuariibius sp. 2305UL40-4]|uniref:ABC transporter substrate-binding protein n=1 Tax=Aestuariibius violaceus TaxID=3234132 RepID=UPI00345F15C5